MQQVSQPETRWVITKWTDHVLDAQTPPNPDDAGLRCFSRLRIDSYNGVRPRSLEQRRGAPRSSGGEP
jgi:hypothetical protein